MCLIPPLGTAFYYDSLFLTAIMSYPVMHNGMSTKMGLRMVGADLGTAASLTTMFAPVPWLAPAVAVVIGILELCQNVSVNK